MPARRGGGCDVVAPHNKSTVCVGPTLADGTWEMYVRGEGFEEWRGAPEA